MKEKEKYISAEFQDEVDEKGRRTVSREISYDELPAGYELPITLKPYIKRELKNVRFSRGEFVIGNEKMLTKLIARGLSEDGAKKLIADATKPYPILTKEEELAREADISKGLDELFDCRHSCHKKKRHIQEQQLIRTLQEIRTASESLKETKR